MKNDNAIGPNINLAFNSCCRIDMPTPSDIDIDVISGDAAMYDVDVDITINPLAPFSGPDYNNLRNKPSINGVTLESNKTSEEIGVIGAPADPSEGDFLVYRNNEWAAESVAIPSKPSDIGAYVKPSDGIPADDLAERAISSRIWWTNGQITYRMTMKTIPISQLDNNTPTPGGVPLVPRAGDIVVGPKVGATDGVPRYLYTIGDILQGTPYGDLAVLQDFAPSDYDGAYVGPLKVSELQNDSGFGTYTKPVGGIPKSDLEAAVQSSLDKADTALQEHQDISGKLDKTGGTMSGNINMGQNWIKNMHAGTAAYDAVNLKQVQDMIAEGAATYRGSFQTKWDLESQPWQDYDPEEEYYVDANDFAIVITDETHNNECWRYIFTGITTGWEAEYKINDSPLSQAQLDALNSGITAVKVSEFEAKYDKPNTGIPASDMAEGVVTKLWFCDQPIREVTATQDIVVEVTTLRSLNSIQGSLFEPKKYDLVIGPDAGSSLIVKNGNQKYLYIINSIQIVSNVKIAYLNKLGRIGPEKTSELQNDSGFGTYSKPNDGIPASDFELAVQSSLNKADTALQSYVEIDPTVPSWAKSENPPTEIFWAEYGVTGGLELLEAYNAGKEILCKWKGRIYRLDSSPSTMTGSCSFVCVDANRVYAIYATNNLIETTWSTGLYVISHATEASDLGAIAIPPSASNGDFLTYQDGEWIAQSFVETDPTVPSWAKESSKPSYDFSEINVKPSTISGYGITDAYTKSQVDGLVSGVFHYKGVKATVSDLPTMGNVVGDVWHVTADGGEYAWDGNAWQELGTVIDLSNYVQTSRTINEKALSSDITLNASDVGAIPAPSSALVGDFLAYSSDGWIASAPNEYIVTYTLGQTDTCDRTYNEIVTAFNNNATMIAKVFGGITGQTTDVYVEVGTYNLIAILPISTTSVLKITHNSSNVITSTLQDLVFDNALSSDSENAVQNKVVKAALDLKADLTDIPTIPVTSVNGQTGDVDLAIPSNASDVGAYALPSGGIPKTDLEVAVQSSLDKADVALPSTGNAYRTASIPFGRVDSTSTSTAFTATVPGITELRDGVCCYLMNGVVTSASGCTLDINGLGAKPLYSTLSAASRSTTIFNINYTMLFVYNSSRVEGGCWDVFYGVDSNTNTIGYQLRTNSLSLPMSQKVYRYRLLFTSADGTKFVPANTSTSTNATAKRDVNQTKIDPFGKIVYYGYTTAIDAGSRPGTSYMWTQYVVTLGYSFNRTGAALVLDDWKPVYIKCAPQSDGSAIIDADNPYVQVLPSTADGKIYIFLGIAVTATTVEIVPEHPIYYHDGTGIRLWSGKTIPTIPSGGSTGQVLKKASGTDYDTEWANESAPVTSVNGQTGAVAISVPSGSYAIPQALGSAWGGSSSDFSRADHVHPKQTALDVGAVAIDQGSENAGKVLVVSSLGVVVPGSYYYNNDVVVNLVITGLDYSGTMDMTPAELSTEYFAGKHIIAYVPAINMRAELFSVEMVASSEYEFNFTAVGNFNSQDVIARFTTSSITSTFTTKIYPLASGQWTGGNY